METGIRIRRLHLLPDLAIVKMQNDLVGIALNADDARGDVPRFGFALRA
jgi:hypothetical protein